MFKKIILGLDLCMFLAGCVGFGPLPLGLDIEIGDGLNFNVPKVRDLFGEERRIPGDKEDFGVLDPKV